MQNGFPESIDHENILDPKRNNMKSGVTNLLGNGSLLNGNNDTILSLNSHNGGTSSDSLHRVFDLQQVSIGTEYGNGTIVRHGYSDLIRRSVPTGRC